MSEADKIKGLISPTTVKVGNAEVRKPTGGTLALCDFANLKLITGGVSELPFFEAMAFFYIHSESLVTARRALFDQTEGVDKDGVSNAFKGAVVDWSDGVDLGSMAEMGDVISRLISEAMSGVVEPTKDAKATNVGEMVTGEKKMPQPTQ